jgi:hypothetical protein
MPQQRAQAALASFRDVVVGCYGANAVEVEVVGGEETRRWHGQGK